jgi:DNA polymerase III subunit delta'
MVFIGNEKAVKFLKNCIEKEKIFQAYLFSGPESVGKFVLAKSFARSIIKRENFSDNFDDEKMPLDLLLIEPEIEKGKEKGIKIEQVRKARKDLSLFPYEGRFKILIINNAHKMNDSAQNALLKILEEPNATSIIILITHQENKILPTIKSRCQKINFSLAKSEDIERGMAKNGHSLENKNDLAYLSTGRPGKANNLAKNETEYRQAKEESNQLKEIISGGTNFRLRTAEEMSADSQRAIQTLKLWTWILRIKTDESQKIRLDKAAIIEKIEKTLEILSNSNANVKMTLENLLINL